MPPAQPPGPYGYPMPGQPGLGPRRGPTRPASRKALFAGGGVLVVIIVAGGVFLAARSSAGSPRTQAESCASWQTEQATIDNQNPTDAAGIVGVLDTDVPAMQTIADSAASGTFRTQMQKTADDFGSFKPYLVVNPGVDLSGGTEPPAELTRIIDSIDDDISAVDGTCRLAPPNATGNGNSGF
jgi:hypothetical protein